MKTTVFKTKVISIMAILLLLIFTISLSASIVGATTHKANSKYATHIEKEVKEIDSFKELKNELEKKDESNELTKSSANEILNATEPEVIEEYIEDSLDNMEEWINSCNDSHMFSLDGGESYKEFSKEFNPGVYANVTLIDEEEENKLLALVSPESVYAASGQSSETVTKEYGNRKFTIKIALTLAKIEVARLCLVNHYTISSKGLDVRYASCAGTTAKWMAEIASEKTKITDKSARKEGADIDVRGDYKVKVKVPVADVHVQTRYGTLMNYVKLLKLNKGSAKLRQHGTYEY